MTELSHSVISPMSFRLEYKRGSTGPTMFQRYVRIQVDVNPICKQGDVADLLFAITFTLLSGQYILIIFLTLLLLIEIVSNFEGNIRRFRRICEHIQTQVCSKRYPSAMSPPSQKPMLVQSIQQQQSSQPMSTSSNSAAASAESISCGSADSSDRLSYRERQNETESEVETFFDCNTTMAKPRRSSASSNKNTDDGPSCTAIKSVSSR